MIDLKNKVNVLIVINVVVYILTLYLSASTNLNVYQIFGANQALVLGNGEFYRIITSMFVHGDLIHLFVNMLALSMLAGPVIHFTNEKYTFIVYFIAGIVSSLGVVLFAPSSLVVGSSGAIYGLLGVLIFYAIKQYRMGYQDMIKSLGPIILINLMISFMPGVSMTGHLMGLTCGLVITYFYDKRSRTFF